MEENLYEVIQEIEYKKGIRREVLIEAIKDALRSAYKKNFGVTQKLDIEIDEESGKMAVFVIKEVVDEVKNPHTQISLQEARGIDPKAEVGGSIKIEITPKEFGRIAAQTAKQVIIQRIREAERELIFNEFKDKVGTVLTGVVRRESGGNVFVDIGRTEGILPYREQPTSEEYHIEDRIRVYVLEIKQSAKGPQVILSRTNREFVRRLFEMEVPEIYEGVVEIKAVAREPGYRTKIAVNSKDANVDSVGACIGMRGIRVQSIVNELNGEKIDIVAYNPDPATFIKNALSPAKVTHIQINEEEKMATVVVEDGQLSLAIGKGGQNVRLAARLVGWRLDIKSRTQFDEEQRVKRSIPLTSLKGVGPKIGGRLASAGVSTLFDILNLKIEDLVSIPGIGEATAAKMLQEANRLNKEPLDRLKEVIKTG